MKAALRRMGRRLPRPLQRPVRVLAAHGRRAARSAGVRRRLRPVRWGNLRRTQPLSTRYGYDRGTPIDRLFLDEFFAAHAGDLRGRVLEVRDPAFSGRFGTDVEQIDLLDIDPTNDAATIIADLSDDGALPSERFDCIVVPQTLQYVRDLPVACRNLWHALAPGGVLLVSVPTTAKLDHHLRDVDRWRITPAGLETLLVAACPAATVETRGRGNVLAAASYLFGVAAEELDDRELAVDDDDFPILALARVRKPA